jgi:hypothetical protein
MNFYVVLLVAYTFTTINSMKYYYNNKSYRIKVPYEVLNKDEVIDDTELSDFERILNKFNLLTNEKTSNCDK